MAITALDGEDEILRRIAGGDEHAFSDLFHWYYQPLAQAVLQLTGSTAISQEIVQDVFVKVWLRKEKLSEIGNFSGYLFIMCRNHCFTYLKQFAKNKKMQPEVEQHLLWESELESLDNPADHYRKLILDTVDRLPPQQKKIYHMSRYDGLKYEEIAAQLGISPETVKTQIYYAVKYIRKELSGEMLPVIIMLLTSAQQIHSQLHSLSV